MALDPPICTVEEPVLTIVKTTGDPDTVTIPLPKSYGLETVSAACLTWIVLMDGGGPPPGRGHPTVTTRVSEAAASNA